MPLLLPFVVISLMNTMSQAKMQIYDIPDLHCRDFDAD